MRAVYLDQSNLVRAWGFLVCLFCLIKKDTQIDRESSHLLVYSPDLNPGFPHRWQKSCYLNHHWYLSESAFAGIWSQEPEAAVNAGTTVRDTGILPSRLNAASSPKHAALHLSTALHLPFTPFLFQLIRKWPSELGLLAALWLSWSIAPFYWDFLYFY